MNIKKLYNVNIQSPPIIYLEDIYLQLEVLTNLLITLTWFVLVAPGSDRKR